MVMCKAFFFVSLERTWFTSLIDVERVDKLQCKEGALPLSGFLRIMEFDLSNFQVWIFFRYGKMCFQTED